MAKTSIDRRIVRTRKQLQDALLSLIRTRDYDSISISDICRSAKVGRSTFYAHYARKDDLKRSGLRHLRDMLTEVQLRGTDQGAKPPPLSFSLALFEHARSHLDLYRALIGTRGGAVALSALREALSELVRGELRQRSGRARSADDPREFTVQYLVGAYLSVLTWWLDAGAKLPVQRVDALFRQLATEGIGPG
jgi:AcrR family transcriptional regulator